MRTCKVTLRGSKQQGWDYHGVMAWARGCEIGVSVNVLIDRCNDRVRKSSKDDKDL